MAGPILVPCILKTTKTKDVCLKQFSDLSHLESSGALSYTLNFTFFLGISSHLSPKHEDEDKTMKEKEPSGLEPQKTAKDPHSNHLFKVSVFLGSRPNGTVQPCVGSS